MAASERHPPNPYVGPRSFQQGERIYGRDREANELLNLIVAERIVLLHSPSGAGKTSLVQAALIPRLQAKRFEVLPVVRVNLDPSAAPGGLGVTNRYVASALASLQEAGPDAVAPELSEPAPTTLAAYLSQRPSAGTGRYQILIFDQFEEILTLDPTDRDAKREFFSQLGEALADTNRWALFSMREDFVAALKPYLLPIPNRFNTTFRLDLLGTEAAALAIQEPALQAGVEFEDAAARQLIDDLRRVQVQQPDGTLEPQLGLHVEPVQLQVVCYRLWDSAATADGRITRADLASFGQVDQSLVDQSLASYYAESVSETIDGFGVSERAVREWFDQHLITELGVRGTVLRGREQSEGLDNEVIQRVVDAHLVRGENRGGATWYELAHDRLIGPVRTSNAAWFKANLSLVQEQAGKWDQQGRPESLLLRKDDLVAAEEWANAFEGELLAVEEDYLRAGRELFARERRARRRNQAIAVLAVVSFVFGVAAFFAFLNAQSSKREAEAQSERALARQLAAQSIGQGAPDRVLSLLTALESLRATSGDGFRLPVAEEALRSALKDPLSLRLPGTPAQGGHDGPINVVAFSPDGSMLATGGEDATARLWSPGDPTAEAKTLEGHEVGVGVTSLAFSRDGSWLATGSEDATALLWNLKDPNAAPTRLVGHEDAITSLAFSPDGSWLATASRDTDARLWSLEDPGAASTRLMGHNGFVLTLAFSPDGNKLATGGGGDGVGLVWTVDDITAGPVTLTGHDDDITSVAFSPDGTSVATGSKDRTIRLWTLADVSAPTYVLQHRGPVNSVALSPDGHWLASGSGDLTARLWDLEDPAGPNADPTILRHSGIVEKVAFDAESRWLATGSRDHTGRLFDLTDPNPDGVVLGGHEAQLTTLDFGPGGRWLATGGDDGFARLWDLEDLSTRPAVLDHRVIDGGNTVEVETLAFSPDGGRLATGSSDKTVRLWDLEDLDAAPGLLLHEAVAGFEDAGVTTLAFSPDGRLLATGSGDRVVRLWDLDAPGSDPMRLQHDDFVNALAFSPDGRRLAVAVKNNSAASLWDLDDLTAQALRGHESEVTSVAFSPDGEWLATGSRDTTVLLWRPGDLGTEPKRLAPNGGFVTAVAFSPDGLWLATGGRDETVKLWSMEGDDPTVEYQLGTNGPVTGLAYSPDGKLLATSAKQSIQLWNLEITDPADPTANPALLPDHTGLVNAVTFSPDGRWFATAGADETARLWLLLDELADMGCAGAGRNFTQDEWHTFLPDEPYRKTCEQWPEGT